MRIYIETSVISAYHFGPPGTKRPTHSFFAKCALRDYELLTSEVAIREIDEADMRIRRKLRAVLAKHRVKVGRMSPQAFTLTDAYLEAGLIPKEVSADAEHIAAASILAVDALVSWNLRHIVNLRTKLMVKEINEARGHPVPSIIRPDEVV